LPAAAGWGLVERSRDSRETIAPDKVRWRLTYRFAPREPGEKVPFQFPDVAYRDGDNEYIASWQPEVFTVETRVGKSDKALRDITAIETMPPQPPADSSWPWWSVGGAGFLLLVVAVLASRFLMKRRRPRTATELALYEWDRLVAMKLPEKGRSERFITLLTLLVRRYLERQFALPARSRTTPEFVRHLEQSAVLAPEQTQFLLQFLQRSEAVKFAHEAMTADECHEWAERARDFLRHSAQTTATRLST
jgi:hypothetical protein